MAFEAHLFQMALHLEHTKESYYGYLPTGFAPLYLLFQFADWIYSAHFDKNTAGIPNAVFVG